MNGVDDFLKGNLLAGLLVGVGVVVLAPVVLPVLATVTKPLAKSAIKTGVILFDRGREAAAEMAEVFEDLVAEARSELETPRSPTFAETKAESDVTTETFPEAARPTMSGQNT
ncbi:DUF5132 domain-containing protein [Cupriavidus necator]